MKAAVQPAAEHEFEAELGLPEPLPAGERLLWQGAPDWRVLARRVFHLQALTIYFSAIVLLHGATQVASGASVGDAAASALILMPLVLAILAIAMYPQVALHKSQPAVKASIKSAVSAVGDAPAATASSTTGDAP